MLNKKHNVMKVFKADDINEALTAAGIIDEDFDIRVCWDIMDDDCCKYLDLDNDIWYPAGIYSEEAKSKWEKVFNWLKEEIGEECVLVDVYNWF